MGSYSSWCNMSHHIIYVEQNAAFMTFATSYQHQDREMPYVTLWWDSSCSWLWPISTPGSMCIVPLNRLLTRVWCQEHLNNWWPLLRLIMYGRPILAKSMKLILLWILATKGILMTININIIITINHHHHHLRRRHCHHDYHTISPSKPFSSSSSSSTSSSSSS